MEEIAVSKFKATCLSVVAKVNRTRKPVRLMRFGKPYARIVPDEEPMSRKEWIGNAKGTGEILGDIVGPSTDPEDWDALR
jgi:antitoxin (DNA-binding transcriptional repressor) of toxin-antitoxin stability system